MVDLIIKCLTTKNFISSIFKIKVKYTKDCNFQLSISIDYSNIRNIIPLKNNKITCAQLVKTLLFLMSLSLIEASKISIIKNWYTAIYKKARIGKKSAISFGLYLKMILNFFTMEEFNFLLIIIGLLYGIFYYTGLFNKKYDDIQKGDPYPVQSKDYLKERQTAYKMTRMVTTVMFITILLFSLQYLNYKKKERADLKKELKTEMSDQIAKNGF